MYKSAIKKGLRFPTPKGVLHTEQLFQLSMSDLATAIKETAKLIESSKDNGLDFLVSTAKVEDSDNKLRFDILKDVYLTKQSEAANKLQEAAQKARRAEILSIIEDKKAGALREMSIEELENLIKE